MQYHISKGAESRTLINKQKTALLYKLYDQNKLLD